MKFKVWASSMPVSAQKRSTISNGSSGSGSPPEFTCAGSDQVYSPMIAHK